MPISIKFNYLSRCFLLILVIASLLVACSGQSTKGTGIQGSVWVADEHGNSISVIDASKNRVITSLTGVDGPRNIQVAPEQQSVWAVSGHESLALMVNVETLQLHGVVPTGSEPAHIILSPDGKRLIQPMAAITPSQ